MSGPPRFRRPSRSGLMLGGGFLLLAAFLMASVLFSVRQQGDDALLRHSLEVEVSLNDVLSALQDAEIGQRGFLLTGDESFLVPYSRSADEIDRRLAMLGASVQDSAVQTAAFTRLRLLVTRKRAELSKTLELHRSGDASATMSLVRGRAGVLLMDEIRRVIEAMDAEEDRLVAQRQAMVRHIGVFTSATTALSLLLMGGVALAASSEVRKRARLERFLPIEVASRLAANDENLRRGRSRLAAVAFVDIRNSTGLSEALRPAALSAILTTFRRAVSLAAHRHGGMVDKFVGDGALVVFGALDGDARAPAQSIAFARELRRGIADARTKDAKAALEIGIGIHHGEVFCGIVGDDDRLEFTILGDTVNVASRIEQATKTFATTLLVSEAALARAGEDFATWQKVSSQPLRGRQGTVDLYVEVASSQSTPP